MILPQQFLNPKIKPKWWGSLGVVESAVAYNCRIHRFPVPVMAMPCLEGAGNKAYDLSGKMNHGTLTNGPKWVGGQFGQSLQFNGTNSYIINGLNGTALSRGTVSLWINPTGAQITKGIFQWATSLSSTSPFILLQRKDATTVTWYVNSGYNNTTSVNDGELCNLTITWDGSIWKFYKNGIAQTPYAGGRNNIANAISTYFGNGYNGYFSGNIDNICIFNVDLIAAKVKFLYDNPYFMFQPIPVPYGYVAPPVGGLSIPVAIHHYQHNIRI